MADDYWSRRAASYDRLQWVHDPDLLGWVAAHVLGGSPSAPNVLDIGCGTGALSVALAEEGARVLAVDTSPEMIRRAKPHPRVQYWLGDALEVGATFDVVVARMVLHHQPSPADAIQRWLDRLVRPGGVLAIAEGVPPAGLHGEAADLFRAAMALKEPGRHTFCAADVAQWMLAAGAVEVAAHERFTERNSVRNWLSGNAMSDESVGEIMSLHSEARHGAVRDYRLEVVDGDVLMRWRHAVVVGRRG